MEFYQLPDGPPLSRFQEKNTQERIKNEAWNFVPAVQVEFHETTEGKDRTGKPTKIIRFEMRAPTVAHCNYLQGCMETSTKDRKSPWRRSQCASRFLTGKSYRPGKTHSPVNEASPTPPAVSEPVSTNKAPDLRPGR